MKKLLVIVPGFGTKRHLQSKLEWMKSNLARLMHPLVNTSVRIFQYNCWEDVDLKQELSMFFQDKPDQLTVIKEKGIVGQFLYKHCQPKDVVGYDYVMILFDDIVLPFNFNIADFIARYQLVKLDILSVTLVDNSPFIHLMGRGSQDMIRKTNFAELFVYLMSYEVYCRYITTFFDEQSVWLWGIDGTLDAQKFSIGLDDKYTVRHMIKGEGYNDNSLEEDHNAWDECCRMESKFGPRVKEGTVKVYGYYNVQTQTQGSA